MYRVAGPLLIEATIAVAKERERGRETEKQREQERESLGKKNNDVFYEPVSH